MPNSDRKLLLNELENGLPGISKSWGKFLCEASSHCLSLKNHASGVEMQVKGNSETVYRFFWSNEISEQTRKAWNDTQELTEYGATGIAIFLIQEMTEFMVIRRLSKVRELIIGSETKPTKNLFRMRHDSKFQEFLRETNLKSKHV